MRKLLFDEPYYLQINEARWSVANDVLETLINTGRAPINTCIDIGCGPGWFTERIHRMGIHVRGLEGRKELVEIASSRCPEASFVNIDLEDAHRLRNVPPADLVFCFGLLYHIENPFMLLRNLYALTRRLLFIESIFVPSDHPCAWLVEEGRNETQGLTHHSFILSRPSLIAILQRVGFPFIYQYHGTVAHPDFSHSVNKHPRRGIFIAAKEEIDLINFTAVSPVSLTKFDFTKMVTLNS